MNMELRTRELVRYQSTKRSFVLGRALKVLSALVSCSTEHIPPRLEGANLHWFRAARPTPGEITGRYVLGAFVCRSTRAHNHVVCSAEHLTL